MSARLSGSECLLNLVSCFQTPQMQTLPRSLSPASVSDFNSPKACKEFSLEIFVCASFPIFVLAFIQEGPTISAAQVRAAFPLLKPKDIF